MTTDTKLPFHHCLVVIQHRLHQDGHGGAFRRIERGIERGVTDREKLAWVGVPPAKLVVLLPKKCPERGQLTRIWTTANQRANDER